MHACTHAYIPTYLPTCLPTYMQPGSRAGRQAAGQSGRQAAGQAGRQAGTVTYLHTDAHTHTQMCVYIYIYTLSHAAAHSKMYTTCIMCLLAKSRDRLCWVIPASWCFHGAHSPLYLRRTPTCPILPKPKNCQDEPLRHQQLLQHDWISFSTRRAKDHGSLRLMVFCHSRRGQPSGQSEGDGECGPFEAWVIDSEFRAAVT